MDLSNDQIARLSREELVQYLVQTKEEFNDYQTSSSEVEQMMDAEIEELKGQLKRAENKYQQVANEQERSKDRQNESRSQWVQVEEQLRRENAQLKEENERQKERIRKLEQRNDVLEMSDRNKDFMANDLGNKLDNAIEKIAMLENELYERQIAVEEMHRLREELRTTERPRLVVEPLRIEANDEAPEEPSPGPSKENLANVDDDVCMEEYDDENDEKEHEAMDHMDDTMTKIEDVHIHEDENKNKEEDKNRRTSTGAGACVNRIVKDLMSKVERLENLLSTIRISNNNTLTTTRA